MDLDSQVPTMLFREQLRWTMIVGVFLEIDRYVLYLTLGNKPALFTPPSSYFHVRIPYHLTIPTLPPRISVQYSTISILFAEA